MSFIENLEPKNLWKYFEEISRIPRSSKQEGKIREYIKDFACKRNLRFHEDSTGNVLIYKRACGITKSVKEETLPTMVLQAHLDMVCEKNESSNHDFSKDPVLLKLNGDYVSAVDTSLGADNGIGVAAMLAILESSEIKHPPLECLFTVDEEGGFDGAFGIKPDLLKGKIMINLDGEDENIYTGCAGAGNTFITFPLQFKKSVQNNKSIYVIQVSGLNGGHSGIDIHLGKGNANELLTRVLWRLNEKFDFDLVDIQGGNKLNAIPRESKAKIVLNTNDFNNLKVWLDEFANDLYNEFKPVEPALKITINPVKEEWDDMYVVEADLKNKLVSFLTSLPNGVIKMCYHDDIVETSMNFASIRTDFDNKEKMGGVSVQFMNRSFLKSELTMVRNRLKAIANIAGANVREGKAYPGWKITGDSDILNLSKRVYEKLFGHVPSAKIVHAGLECGIIGDKFPGMEIISTGPYIENPHSIKEKVSVLSVSKFFEFLKGILSKLCE